MTNDEFAQLEAYQYARAKQVLSSPTSDQCSQWFAIQELIRIEKEKAAWWGFPGIPETLRLMGQLPPDTVTFEELLKHPKSQHKAIRQLVEFLEHCDYPYIGLGIITITGYERALRLRDDTQRARKCADQQRHRARVKTRKN